MAKSIRSRALLSAAAVALAPAALVTTSVFAPAAAQDYTSGGLDGGVIDGAGNPVSGANVTIRSNAQGAVRRTTTNSRGSFRASGLPQGSYTVEIQSSAGNTSSDSVRVQAGTSLNYTFVVGASAGGDEVVVRGTRQNLDFANTTTGVNIDLEDLVKDVPIGRDITSVTLLAPGVTLGDTSFGRLPSIGAGSVAENVYYINGLNLTNFDNGLGGSIVPFEFYKSVEVKTGGYAAEFGRATGGVINAVTKSGTNEWKGAIHLNYGPDALRSDSPDTLGSFNSLDEVDSFSAILEVGGPIIKDKLFVYGLAQFRDNTSLAGTRQIDGDTLTTTGGNIVRDKADDPFWGIKVDAYPIEGHHLEFTYFDTELTTNRSVFPLDISDNSFSTGFGEELNSTQFRNGGESFVGKYTASLTDWLTVSAAYGQNDDRGETISSLASVARSVDLRNGGFTELSPQTTSNQTFPRTTSREFIRGDVDVLFSAFGDHHLRFGFDIENLDFTRTTIRNGPTGALYVYRTATATTPQADGTPALAPGDEYVQVSLFNSGGFFESRNIAYYVQDEWDVTDRLTLNLGVRLDQFNNFTADGSQFVDFNNEFAPRAGFSYDVFGDGSAKFFGNYGEYYLPVASNTAFRHGAQEFFFSEYFLFTDILADGVPEIGTQIVDFSTAGPCPLGIFGAAGTNGCAISGDGSAQDPTASISRNLEATKEREFLVGYEQTFGEWTLGLTYINRKLLTTAEDAAVDDYINTYCDDPANGVDQSVTDCSNIWSGFHQYTILNPGQASTIVFSDVLPGETELREVTFSAAELGFPKAERNYQAVQFAFNKPFNGTWALRGSYTWSRTKGNTEGYVQSDFGQADAGITQDFDKLGFLDNAFGFLPQHRAHEFKVWGSYSPIENFTIGSNASLFSPRKFGCFGLHPDSGPSPDGPGTSLNLYGAASRFCDLDGDGTSDPAPRGTISESDWIFDMDVSLRYTLELATGNPLTLRADVFNLLNLDGVTQIDEFGETGGGDVRAQFGTPQSFQAPRSVRLGLDIEF